MFTPEQMQQIHVVFSNRDIDPVAEVIVRLGTLQVVDSVELESWAGTLEKAGTGEESEALRLRRERVETLIRDLRLNDSLEKIEFEPDDWESIDVKLDSIVRQVRDEQALRDRCEQEYDRLRELRRRIGEAPLHNIQVENRDAYSYLAIETGRVADSNLDLLRRHLEDVLHVLTPLNTLGGFTTLIVITLRRDKGRLDAALQEAGFQRIAPDHTATAVSPGVLKDADRQIEEIQGRIEKIQSRLDVIARKHDDFLRRTLFRIRHESLKTQIIRFFRKTEQTFLLSGWLPRTSLNPLIAELKHATGNRCVIETMPAENVESVRAGRTEVPVRLRNPKIFRPFELITSAYGVPAYQTIDPTPVVAISFLLMFGMMFGDVGHGAVLLLLGFLLSFGSRSRTTGQAGGILIYAGLSSILFGFLFGSVFGIEHWLPSIWVRPMDSISRLFKTAIYFGIGMICVSIAINVINGLMRRDLIHVLLDKAGLVAAVLYWSGIVIVTRILSADPSIRGKTPILIIILLASAMTLLFLREPILHLAEGRKKLYPDGVATGIIGGLMEVLEIVLGFLTNTVSFIRVAAFGLAHTGLLMAVFSLSDMVGGVGSVLIHLFGNIVIILLEGMIVTIQVMRLEFYEFFGRFFKEGTVLYHPVHVETGCGMTRP
ncbi:MAG TPA: hypothetical protein ENN17_07190 [bacterium]|nr:hypothetical protein [bacterium]